MDDIDLDGRDQLLTNVKSASKRIKEIFYHCTGL